MSSPNLFYLDSAKVEQWIGALLKEYSVFIAAEKESAQGEVCDYSFEELADPSGFQFNPYRPVEPLKSFFTPYLEKVAEYFDGRKVVDEWGDKSIVFGIKACDLAAHEVQDYVFLEGVEEDPFYRLKRDNTLLISGDCTDFKEVCYCMAMGGAPCPESEAGFDLNLSPLDNNGYILESGSERGEELIEKTKECFVDANEEQINQREANRRKVAEQLAAHLEKQKLPQYDTLQDIVTGGMDAETWDNFALTCVECGGCNFICDTCHCFLLSDKKAGEKNQKMRMWDSCQYKNFATVAGGATPMKTRSERLRNRFLKKFDFFVENLGKPACCGCGRCIEVCIGEIDIREVLKDLEKNG